MTIIYILGGLVGLIILLALVNGKQLDLEASVTINKPVQEVFECIKYVKNQDNFSVWNMTDPSMKKEYSGTDGQVGFIYAWDSTNKNVGAGEQEIKKITPGQAVDFELRFSRPMQDVAQARMTTTAAGQGQTNVTWSFNSMMKFPMTAVKPIFRNILTKQLQTGLDNLKKVMEK